MKIKNIKKIPPQPTWDIEVPDGHEFKLGNGVVTHNTAQILGNNECFEPYTSNLYKRNTLSGEFIVVNRHLVEDLIALDLWNENMRIELVKNNGSIQNIESIPQDIKDVYRTVWEMKASNLIDMSADRGLFICQSQSMNLFIRDVNVGKLNKALLYGWKKGLKTGMYYLRSNAKAQARQSLGVDIEMGSEDTTEVVTETVNDINQDIVDGLNCSLDDPDGCLMCGS